jgi:hypothetical protein
MEVIKLEQLSTSLRGIELEVTENRRISALDAYYKYGNDLTGRGFLLGCLPYSANCITLYLLNPKTKRINLVSVNEHSEIRKAGFRTRKLPTLMRAYKPDYRSMLCRVGMQLGADPEIFVVDGNDKIIPAFTFLKSKKASNLLYYDGFQAEFTCGIHNCLSFLVDEVHERLDSLHRRAKVQNGKLTLKNVLPVAQNVLVATAPEHVELGCMPSMNAYGLRGRPVPDPYALRYRFAGGHIHFGFTDSHELNKLPQMQDAVRALDGIVGLIGVSLAANIDNPLRREFYGLAGEYRLPAHGLEYRSLSNFWLAAPPITHLIYDVSRIALSLGLKGAYDLVWKAKEGEVIEAINGSDVKLARRILRDNRDVLKNIIKQVYSYRDAAQKTAFDVAMDGMEYLIKDPTDIVGNWRLEKPWAGHTNADRNDFNHASTNLVDRGEKYVG